jgi:hypothetical protein
MKDYPIVHRAVGSDDDVVSSNDVSVARRHSAWLAIGDCFSMRV